MNNPHPSHFDLQAAAKQLMLQNGFEPDFPPAVAQQLAAIKTKPSQPAPENVQDLRKLLWSSIDNDTSRDLDQIEYAEKLSDGTTMSIPSFPKARQSISMRARKRALFIPACATFPCCRKNFPPALHHCLKSTES
jgi:hypothetical protein